MYILIPEKEEKRKEIEYVFCSLRAPFLRTEFLDT